MKRIIAEKEGLEEQVDITTDAPLPNIARNTQSSMNLPKILENDDAKLQRYERVID